MKTCPVIKGTLIACTLLLSSHALAEKKPRPMPEYDMGGEAVIANRGSGDISIIDASRARVSATIPLPPGEFPPEPMYVVHVPKADSVFVGDRANNRVVIFDDEDYTVTGSLPTGNGVFHMWADPEGSQLWVNNDIDNTATVIDPMEREVIATVPMPDDLVSMGGKPHDVVLDPTGDAAYVSMVGLPGESDYIVKFSTDTFTEEVRAAVGKDPHVSLTRRNDLLFVPTQNANAVYVLERDDLEQVEVIPVPAAHGAGMPSVGKIFYTTNISGGGSDGLYAINMRKLDVVNVADTPFPTPHNLVLSNTGRQLFVTHSGATADKVSLFSVSRKGRMKLRAELTVGTNPFGLAYVP